MFELLIFTYFFSKHRQILDTSYKFSTKLIPYFVEHSLLNDKICTHCHSYYLYSREYPKQTEISFKKMFLEMP